MALVKQLTQVILVLQAKYLLEYSGSLEFLEIQPLLTIAKKGQFPNERSPQDASLDII